MNTLCIVMATTDNDCTVNELLCFMINEMNTMPADLIAKLVGDLYDEKEVVGAKECLLSPYKYQPASYEEKGGKEEDHEHTGHSSHPPQLREVEDIPCFIARHLSNLPPITQDHFDIAFVMRNITNMQHELSTRTTLKDDVNILQAQITDISQRRHADDSDPQNRPVAG